MRVLAAVRDSVWPPKEALYAEVQEFRIMHAKRAQLSVMNGRLYYTRPGPTQKRRLFVVPPLARSSVITECHDAPVAAHFAERKTLDNIRQRFWWPALKADVRLYCRLCTVCQNTVTRKPPGHAPMQVFAVGAPWEILGVDFVGPLMTTARRNRYCLTMVDHYTRLTVLVPTTNMTAETTALVIMHKWVAYYGVPRVLHSDRGTNFASDVILTLCDRLSIRKTFTTPYRPQADGRVERVNRTLKECLTRLFQENAADWDMLLPSVAMAINSSKHESTGYTPFFLAHGTDMQLPVDLALPAAPVTAQSQDQFVDQLLARLRVAYAHASMVMDRQITRSKTRYDVSAKVRHYVINDQVYYRNPNPNFRPPHKFVSSWSGPFTVIQVLGDVTVRIRENSTRLTHVVHTDTLKPWSSPVDASAPEDTSKTPNRVSAAPMPTMSTTIPIIQPRQVSVQPTYTTRSRPPMRFILQPTQ